MSHKGSRRSKDKKLLSVFLACSLVFLCTIGFSLYKMVQVSKTSKINNSSDKVALLKSKRPSKDQDKDTKKEDPNVKKETTIKISAIGDCTLGEDSNFRGNVFTSVYNSENDPAYFFSGVHDVLSKDDLTIANLEGPLTTRGEKAVKKFSFKGKPEYTKILTSGSVEAVNLANNHSMDYGTEALEDTMKYLKEDKIDYFGNGEKAIVEKNGIKIGLLGYKGWNNTSEVRSTIENDINEMKTKANLIIVTFHWGAEGAATPNNAQKALGKFAVDSGADLVLGHHPHVIQGIEEYNGKNIVYSLGNFCFGGNTNPKDKDTYIYQQSFTFDASKKLIKSNEAEKIPVSISSVKNRNDYKPTVLEGEEKDRVLKKIETRSESINNKQ